MDFRKEKDVEAFLENVETRWKLSLDETNLIERCLFSVLEGDDIRKTTDVIDAVALNSWGDILDLVPRDETQWYAERHFHLIDEDDCESCEEKELDDFPDDEIEQEYFDRFKEEKFDIVTEQQLEELKDNFLVADFKMREKIIEVSRL